MTKVLLCDWSLDGHRKAYMKELAKIETVEIFCCAPENIGVKEDHFFACEHVVRVKDFKLYRIWINEIAKIVDSYSIDIVHFLDGDSIRRFFGSYFTRIHARLFITYHHYFSGIACALAYKLMLRTNTTICITHTENMKVDFVYDHCVSQDRVKIIRYPSFDYSDISSLERDQCRKYFGITDNAPVIGIIGGICSYKNILRFLATMQKCNAPYRLLICGRCSDISEKQVYDLILPYKEKVSLILRLLSKKEYQMAIKACDIIYSIYNSDFDGASGPLTDAISIGKLVISTQKGSLGQIVEENHLGYTCNPDDNYSILECANKALLEIKSFSYDQVAMNYQKSLSIERFQQSYSHLYCDICDYQ